jgi:5'-nucleotidase
LAVFRSSNIIANYNFPLIAALATKGLCMPIELNETLVVGISATALFDLSESDEIFKQKSKSDPDSAIDEYRKHMLEKEDEPLEDGTGMSLVRSLL